MGRLKILWVLALAMLIVPTLAFASGKKCGHQNSGCLRYSSYEYGYGYSWRTPPYEPYRYKPHVLPNGDFYFSTPGADHLPYISSGRNYRSWDGYGSDYGYYNGY